MHLQNWEALFQQRRMRRAYWIGALLVGLYVLVAIPAIVGGLH